MNKKLKKQKKKKSNLRRFEPQKTQQKIRSNNTMTKQITPWLLIPIVDYVSNLNQHKNLERESGRKIFRERDTKCVKNVT